MTDADRAREVLADAYDHAGYPDEATAFRAGEWTCHDHPALAAMRTAIAQAHAAGRVEGLEDGRREGLEEAAKVADDHAYPDYTDDYDAYTNAAAERIATAIRARITTSAGGE